MHYERYPTRLAVPDHVKPDPEIGLNHSKTLESLQYFASKGAKAFHCVMSRLCGESFFYDPVISRLCVEPVYHITDTLFLYKKPVYGRMFTSRMCVEPVCQDHIHPTILTTDEEILNMLKYSVSRYDEQYYFRTRPTKDILYSKCLYLVVEHGFIYLMEYSLTLLYDLTPVLVSILCFHHPQTIQQNENCRKCLSLFFQAINADVNRIDVSLDRLRSHKCDLLNYGLSHEIMKKIDMDLYRNMMKWHAKKISTLKSLFCSPGIGTRNMFPDDVLSILKDFLPYEMPQYDFFHVAG